MGHNKIRHINLAIGERLEGIRKRLLGDGRNLSQMAELLNFPVPQYCKWERGGGVRLDNLLELINRYEQLGVTRCTLDWLVLGKGDEPIIGDGR